MDAWKTLWLSYQLTRLGGDGGMAPLHHLTTWQFSILWIILFLK